MHGMTILTRSEFGESLEMNSGERSSASLPRAERMNSSPAGRSERGGEGDWERAEWKAEMPERDVNATAEKWWRREIWWKRDEMVEEVGVTTTVGQERGMKLWRWRRRESREA